MDSFIHNGYPVLAISGGFMGPIDGHVVVEQDRVEQMHQKVLAALLQAQEAQKELLRLRSDYATTESSKFSRARSIWLLLKATLGISKQSDRFLAVSPPLRVQVTHERQNRQVALVASEYAEILEVLNRRLQSSPGLPTVSIIIPAFNQLPVTMRCLKSIADGWFESLAIEIVVVDDGSSDDTAAVMAQARGVTFLRNGMNSGFIRSCNRAASISRGKYLLFLNNDTEVCDGWLDHLVNTAEQDPLVGIVGPKLVYPDGRLQEAGNIIWQDGAGWNYGRFDDPDDPLYNFPREVDYVSGASLLVRRALFHQVGSFNEELCPAYYEDTDLCFAVRDKGYKVVYEPRSKVIHYEGISSGTDLLSGTKRFQEVNRPKFVERWQSALKHHYRNSARNAYLAARRLGPEATILIVDSYVPLHDRESGSLRLLNILKILRSANYRVVFMPDNLAGMQPYTAELQALGIEVVHHTESGRTPEQRIEEVLPLVDLAWVCRCELAEKWLPRLRRHPKIRIIYDTIDLYFVRLRRQAEIEQSGDATTWRRSEALEISCARNSDATITVTRAEKEILEERGVSPIFVIPNIHDTHASLGLNFEARHNLLFIGGYQHPPNVDAVRYLVKEIMPLVWRHLPDMELTLLGSNPTTEVLSLRSSKVIVPGYVRDVAPYFHSHRLFVAPLRYGAGLKGKVGQSLSYGLPTVTTSIGAEGFEMDAGTDFALAENPEEFAEQIVGLYSNSERWNNMSRRSSQVIRRFSSKVNSPAVVSVVESMLNLRPKTQLPQI